MHQAIRVAVMLALTASLRAASYRVPRAAYSVYAGDLNLNGHMDIVVGHQFCPLINWGGLSIMLNNGDGTFTLTDSLSFPNGFPRVNGACLDQNPYIDIFSEASEPYKERQMGVVYNIGYQGFDNVACFPLNTEDPITAISHGDVDNDGDTDIVFSSFRGDRWGLIYNDGTGRFSETTYLGRSGSYIACGDLNNDGRDDVVIRGNGFFVYFSRESGFDPLPIEENWIHGEIMIADVDLDGNNDIITHSRYMGYTVFVIFENRGDETFKGHNAVYFPFLSSNFRAADMNNSGYPDLVCIWNEDIFILYNQGGFVFTEPVKTTISTCSGSTSGIYCADFDGNGFNDILVFEGAHGYLSKNLHIIFNDGHGGFVAEPLPEEPPVIPDQFALYASPNPFNSETKIIIDLPDLVTDARLMIYDIRGRLVRKWPVRPVLSARSHEILWDGRDEEGKRLPSGVYIARLCSRDRLMMGKEKFSQLF